MTKLHVRKGDTVVVLAGKDIARQSPRLYLNLPNTF